MKKPPVATVVNFCTNEKRYLKPCLEEALKFSRQVIVCLSDHFFDGTLEDRELLETIYSTFPECQFVEYPFIPAEIPQTVFKNIDPAHFWHSLSRLIGVKFLDEDIESVLFLDADEIVEGEKFKSWLLSSDYHEHTVIKLANFWYFRLPEYQALQWEDSPVLVQRRAVTPEMLLATEEREAIYASLPGPKKRMVAGPDGVPMVHHYSWVRTEEEMLKKVRSWGHKKDRDWESLVKKEFASPFQGTDFVHSYTFRTVSSPFEIHMGEVLFSPQGQARLTRLSKPEILSLLKFTRNGLLAKFSKYIFGK